jgi:hypothetical protein
MEPLGTASKRGVMRTKFFAVALAAGLGASACTEPVDCTAEPERCPLVVPPTTRAGTAPVVVPAPVVARARAQQANQAQAQRDRQAAAKQAAEERTLKARIRADAELQAEQARLGDLSPKERLHRTPEALIRRIRNVGANKNLVGLKRFMTEDFARRVDTMVADSPDRFWRHVARYVNAAEHGFELTSRPGPREGTRQLEVKGRGEMTLRPIVERSPKGWLFDRF